MIQSIQYRKTSFLLEGGWQNLNPEIEDNTAHQRFVDQGLLLGALQEELDNQGLQTSDLPLNKINYYVQRIADLDKTLDECFENLVVSLSAPFYWTSEEFLPSGPREESSSTRDNSQVTPAGPPFTFSSLASANSATLYWALKIVIAATQRQVTNSLRKSPIPISSHPSPKRDQHLPKPPSPPPPSYNLPYYTMYPDRPAEPVDTTGYTSRRPPFRQPENTNLPLYYATLILRSMPYILSPDQNMLGPQRALFPLRVTLFLLRIIPSNDNPLLTWCKEIYQLVEDGKGLKYAGEISKLDGGHGTRGNERYLAGGATPAVSPGPMPNKGPYEIGEGEGEGERAGLSRSGN